MSVAGIRSNRGDIFQTLVALDWALTVLSDPDFEWLEVDSTRCLVDDVVVGKSNGIQYCCQCKKNQTNFDAWSISDLADEIVKASQELDRNPDSFVLFYSRSNFGKLAKLKEFSTNYRTETDYLESLTKEHTKTNTDLADCIIGKAPDLSTYEFLRRTSFEVSPEIDRMKSLLKERLKRMASNSEGAFNAISTRLTELSGRIQDTSRSASTQHLLTKSDLKEILDAAGSMLVPVVALDQVCSSFSKMSSIGRSWQRNIAGERIASPIMDELLSAVDAKTRSVLLTGLPGSGKTCALLELQEALENKVNNGANIAPLFIQSREFADLTTSQERQALGLSQHWVEHAARLAEDRHVIVIIDSLDVLSIGREHNVLTYFLAQMDQLLLISNVTVITACREFDRKYDRRIALREWDVELQCKPLDWDVDIIPLLDKHKFDACGIDNQTRKLIKNPRELALFMELAIHQNSSSAITRQAMAQDYLDNIVVADPQLGDVALRAIEGLAIEMLRTRSLSVTKQSFSASHDVLRILQSLNILQDTHYGRLAFGHQTLLDVLVISDALRRGISLNEFIQGLPAVPFVRPSIRSFVEQLAVGERRDFRRQVRTVLTSNSAFHIRRLVAESLALQRPMDGDWLLIRDLRDNHRETFQVIYAQASSVEWHFFWLSHLVPLLKEMRDDQGIASHVYRIGEWKNIAPEGVLRFWKEALSIDWLVDNGVVDHIGFSLCDLDIEHFQLAVPLLEELLTRSKSEHNSLGRVVSKCVGAGFAEDDLLWRYIVGDVREEDVLQYRFNGKLNCGAREFGDEGGSFLRQRMLQSSNLLDLALNTIEEWSNIKSSKFGETVSGYRSDYLNETSYSDAHSQLDHRHVESERVIFDAIEIAIFEHAKNHSVWWEDNLERICFNREGAIRYFSVLALTHFPAKNLEIIGRLLSDKALLESELSYELATLNKVAFRYLAHDVQDSITVTMKTVLDEHMSDNDAGYWVLKNRAEYISTIPCHLRTADAQDLLDSYETVCGTLVRKPSILRRGGIVSAPFTFDVFLNASDKGVVGLLQHYSEYKPGIDEFLTGGVREVGWQLREASSRQPSKFLRLLVEHWTDIAETFRDDIMSGVVAYLAYRHGNLRADKSWEPAEDPDGNALACEILEELNRHPTYWWKNRSAAEALEACAHVINDKQIAVQLVFLAIGFKSLNANIKDIGASTDLANAAINMRKGKVAQALMVLATNLLESKAEFPELLEPTLHQYAGDEHPAVRAMILQYLPYLQSLNADLGWKLFYPAVADVNGIWQSAERCLYYAYPKNFEKVSSILRSIVQNGNNEDMETWARISALAALSGFIDIENLIDDLQCLDIAEAWKGASGVWSNSKNIRQHYQQCIKGIEYGLNETNSHAYIVAREVAEIFRETNPPNLISLDLIKSFFAALESDGKESFHRIHKFDKWLNAISQRDPELALDVAEIYLTYIRSEKSYYHDYDDQLVQLITRLFAEAEEREESDGSSMLSRVVLMQDSLLSIGVNSINDWLKAAERP